MAQAQSAAGDVARAFAEQVTPLLTPPAEEQARYGELATAALRAAGITPLGPQFIVVVDRDTKVQAALLYWLAQPPVFLGATSVSTGRVGQFDHFETPTGVFAHTLANPDFRAEGTRNANGIMGYGAKGMRVYDFGWQTANKGWGDRAPATMRLQMHATDPYRLEQRLGTVQSKGCIRIPAGFNRLIDRLGLLDADYELAAALVARPWVLLRDRTPVAGAGRYLIIVDTARAEPAPWAAPASAGKGKP
ncbi:L,D-transpeptidase [Achromobacter xylosoxidans]|uniref:L,D-transpeptidase n=1 Tax=Alcaligenes xylosoxydans xylosoxydans TaxID=85698 RepID=UPI000666535A|nr:L,D-transpeptidase [Achromobacter xylosoxidans]